MAFEAIVIVALWALWSALLVAAIFRHATKEVERQDRYIQILLSALKRMEDRIHASSLSDYLALDSEKKTPPLGRSDAEEALIERIRSGVSVSAGENGELEING